MSNAAVITVIQHNINGRGNVAATSPYTIRVAGADDHTCPRDIPGLCAGEWTRMGWDDTAPLLEEIGNTLEAAGLTYRVDWP